MEWQLLVEAQVYCMTPCSAFKPLHMPPFGMLGGKCGE